MCGNIEISHGGDAIAIIHSIPGNDNNVKPEPWKIVFKNEIASTQDPTCSSFPLTRYKCLHHTSEPGRLLEKSNLLIHESGDLTSDLARIMRRVTIDQQESRWSSLQENLDLSVGPTGVIGRGVSLVDGGVVVGRGVIGYASR